MSQQRKRNQCVFIAAVVVDEIIHRVGQLQRQCATPEPFGGFHREAPKLDLPGWRCLWAKVPAPIGSHPDVDPAVSPDPLRHLGVAGRFLGELYP